MPILFAATAAERDSRHSLLRPLTQSGSFFRLTLTPPFLPSFPPSTDSDVFRSDAVTARAKKGECAQKGLPETRVAFLHVERLHTR